MFVDIYNTTKRYSIIYVDPPWNYNKRNNKHTRFGGGVHSHYQTMSMEDIEKIPVDKLSGDNCALLLWTTFPYLDKQIQLFEKWGFKYKTLGFSWIKLNSKNGKPFFGIGYYSKSNCEVCLLGIKGKMKPITNSISSCVISPKEKHSKKPNEVRDRIVQLFGDLPRIELFARENVLGWDCWGNEVS